MPHASVERLTPSVAASAFIIGIIVAAKGMLSTNALANAESHIIIATISIAFPPLIFPMKLAAISRIPVCSSPPTTTNKPIKNNNVL